MENKNLLITENYDNNKNKILQNDNKMKDKSSDSALNNKNNNITKSSSSGSHCSRELFLKENEENKMAELISDKFEREFDAQLEDLESHDMVDSEDSDFECTEWKNVRKKIDKPNRSPAADVYLPYVDDDIDVNLINDGLITPEAINQKLPFIYNTMRRLSECMEEEEDESTTSGTPQLNGSASKYKRTPIPPLPAIVLTPPAKNLQTKNVGVEIAGTTRKFIVTKTETVPRREAENLRSMTPKMNSQTIHFPCSSNSGNRQSIKNMFAQDGTPHLDKKFFDTSLVEIRPITDSTKSLDKTDGEWDYNKIDDVWIPRQDALKRTGEADPSKSIGARPHSAPIESKRKSTKKDAKKHEKELKRFEKEARRLEKEKARQLEKEEEKKAKIEKLNRHHEKISRSTERVAPRSGSLERRQSGDDSAVSTQFTVHGIASPNKRPTLFDVFRPRTKSDTKKKEKDITRLSGSDQLTVGPAHVGIMQSMKTALQHTVGGGSHKPSSAETKVKDGSAHLHAGSDAQYYHTVTAVRRADVSRSPMTKVMDLFRHRANSALSEADKRKQRAVQQHKQQIENQSK